MSARSINLRSLDVLRGLLAVYVVVGHGRWLLWAGHSAWLSQPHPWWQAPLAYGSAAFRYGHEAVMVFFVLSGFFIHLRFAKQVTGGGRALEAGEFYRRRLHRLAAPYFFALLVTVLCDLAGGALFPRLYDSATGDPPLDHTFAAGGYSTAAVVPALVMLPSTRGVDFGSNGPLWSLAFEVVYYALYPAWLSLRRRSEALAFGVIPIACLALAFVPGGGFPVNVLLHYPIWLVGALLAERLVAARLPGYTMAGAVIMFALGAVVHVTGTAVLSRIVAALIFGTAAVLAASTAIPPGWLSRAFGAFEYLGVRSYSIYIVHFPFLALLAAAIINTQGARPVHGWFALGGIVLAVAFGCACFEVCERHFLHPRLRVPPVAA